MSRLKLFFSTSSQNETFISRPTVLHNEQRQFKQCHAFAYQLNWCAVVATGLHSWTDCLGRQINRVPRHNCLDWGGRRLRCSATPSTKGCMLGSLVSPITEPACLHGHAVSLSIWMSTSSTEKKEDSDKWIDGGSCEKFPPPARF